MVNGFCWGARQIPAVYWEARRFFGGVIAEPRFRRSESAPVEDHHAEQRREVKHGGQ